MATKTLRPSGVGNQTNLTIGGSNPAATNWQSVDEVTPDDEVTYVYAGAAWTTDTYALPAHVGEGVINSVTVHQRSRVYEAVAGQVLGLRTHDTDYTQAVGTGVQTYDDYSWEHTVNPNTEDAWTWDEVDALEALTRLYNGRTTQIYIVVNYGGEDHTKSLSDSVAIVDATGKTFGAAKSESIGIADSSGLRADFKRTPADTVTITDSPSKASSLIKSDSMSITDSISVIRGLFKSLADSISIADVFVWGRSAIFKIASIFKKGLTIESTLSSALAISSEFSTGLTITSSLASNFAIANEFSTGLEITSELKGG